MRVAPICGGKVCISSSISEWRRLRDAGVLAGDDAAGSRAVRRSGMTAEQAEIAQLKKELDQANSKLATTQTALDIMGILPNGVCLLPPLKTCDKGNACLSCGHFATDTTHLTELQDQYQRTRALIELQRNQFRERTGRELTDDNVWIHERLRELHSLRQIIDRLQAESDAVATTGPGTGKRLPLMQIHTRGAHDTTLHAAPPPDGHDNATAHDDNHDR